MHGHSKRSSSSNSSSSSSSRSNYDDDSDDNNNNDNNDDNNNAYTYPTYLDVQAARALSVHQEIKSGWKLF